LPWPAAVDRGNTDEINAIHITFDMTKSGDSVKSLTCMFTVEGLVFCTTGRQIQKKLQESIKLLCPGSLLVSYGRKEITEKYLKCGITMELL
jgi:hypothetical protein